MLKSILVRTTILLALFCFSFNSYGQSAYELFKEGKEYRRSGKNKKAIKSFEAALDKAEDSRNKKLQMSCHIELAELKDNVINYKEALDHYKAFTDLYKDQMTEQNEELADSVSSLESTVEENLEEMQSMDEEITNKEEQISTLTAEQLAAELDIKDLELENQKHELDIQEAENRRNILFGVIGLVVVILLFFGLGYARKRKTNQTLRNKNYQIAIEKQKSDELLLNILPLKVAEELKEFGRTTTASFDSATIMFTDFKGFTKFSEKHSPEEIVEIIDGYFSAFDEIIEKYGIEKIKTIGDAYMCVSGIPEPSEDHATKMIQAAIEMKAHVQERMSELKENGEAYLEMRIGLHAGPLVAGVVGSRKFAYDVWGDSVNIAARMEQSGEPGKINVSEDVYQLSKGQYEFEFRGEVDAKNKGKMKMYFLVEG